MRMIRLIVIVDADTAQDAEIVGVKKMLRTVNKHDFIDTDFNLV